MIGLGLLAPLFGTVKGGTSINQYQIATGAVLLLIGVTAVLPWAVESVVSRLSGGPIPWQLAIRRLQLNSSSSARMVSGVTVAVAGAIALQMLFTGVNSDFVYDTGADTARAQASVGAPVTDGRQTAAYTEKIRATRGSRMSSATPRRAPPSPTRAPGGPRTTTPICPSRSATARRCGKWPGSPRAPRQRLHRLAAGRHG